ncbi:GNAT family N-acetyltransferase [Limnoglobus roseus]|uniref:N-acetyltransferase n=1 Tax=Limnoglobus roseus TaxID=2598579 RepID=A0A5C1AIC5_9BACT|nr:GNAT family N-acetyltransferase [Limnoglobus roseus]QEL18405.1 N-acetyltransferase [Limnoglobus roseus]
MITSPDVLVRDATLSDVPAIAAMAGEFASYMRDLGDATDLKLNAAAIERDGFGPEPAFRGVVAELAGEVVGYLFHHDGYDTDAAVRLLVVVDLFVTASVRGRGVGSSLMRRAREVAAARSAQQIVWTVHRLNARARKFYKTLGGRCVEEIDLMYLQI